MKRLLWRLGVFLTLLFLSGKAAAEEAKGLVVVATDGATDVAWPLAAKVYTSALLRPAGIDDAKARVLAGEQGPADLSELAELRAGVKGTDAASREVLAAIAQKLAVRGIVVVTANPPSAVLYDAETHAFDAARYAPDSSGAWEATVRSLERPYMPLAALSTTPAEPQKKAPLIALVQKKESKAFYESPWFWVAVGATALLAGGVLIATNIQTGDNIHMQMQWP